MELRLQPFKVPNPLRLTTYNLTRQSWSIRTAHNSASDKLFADAASEEAEANSQPKQSSRLTFLENESENWDGEERIQDAVLRMLVDKYKPLRTGAIQSADQKLKLAPPKVSQVFVTPKAPSTGSWATEPLLPSKEDHRPWHTTFKVPQHAIASIKHASFTPLPAQSTVKPAAIDERARRKAREEKKRTASVGRLATARETTLDYRLGIRGSGGSRVQAQLNPVGLKGWTSLVEDKIEKARKAGLFNSVKGRGKPLVSAVEESNPFIAREEFLMNRIVQRNGAAPPWVEGQGELDISINTFREILRQSWIRRAVRVITSTTPPALLHTFTLGDVRGFRDLEWERQERAYHRVALEEVNAVVRKYNGMAPYAVRRPYYIHNVEMERLFEGCAEEILKQLAERARGTDLQLQQNYSTESRTKLSSTGAGDGADIVGIWSLWAFFKPWIRAVLSRIWKNRRSI